jgi:hypothetical protein
MLLLLLPFKVFLGLSYYADCLELVSCMPLQHTLYGVPVLWREALDVVRRLCAMCALVRMCYHRRDDVGPLWSLPYPSMRMGAARRRHAS